ncbi:uncharacterized protein FRV6_10235 [Fusarium oxysporum]|uniref:Uncharacterized protein n=1 Tax=Fusarium oxysporum TaxID=5507 RepID=A0A2H3TBH0_FUSOX|nr:uncharacterized protein FRV6_10235 [Fusarium oxysporum]
MAKATAQGTQLHFKYQSKLFRVRPLASALAAAPQGQPVMTPAVELVTQIGAANGPTLQWTENYQASGDIGMPKPVVYDVSLVPKSNIVSSKGENASDASSLPRRRSRLSGEDRHSIQNGSSFLGRFFASETRSAQDLNYAERKKLPCEYELETEIWSELITIQSVFIYGSVEDMENCTGRTLSAVAQPLEYQVLSPKDHHSDLDNQKI